MGVSEREELGRAFYRILSCAGIFGISVKVRDGARREKRLWEGTSTRLHPLLDITNDCEGKTLGRTLGRRIRCGRERGIGRYVYVGRRGQRGSKQDGSQTAPRKVKFVKGHSEALDGSVTFDSDWGAMKGDCASIK